MMNPLKKLCVVIFISMLAACGDSDTVVIVDEAAKPDKNTGAEEKPFLFQDMKESLDEAKAVNKSMEKHHQQQKKDLDGI